MKTKNLKEEIIEVLKERGPSGAVTLTKETGFHGTRVVNVLVRNDEFAKDDSQRWHLTHEVEDA